MTQEAAIEIVKRRLSLYEKKRDLSDAFADGDFNQHDKVTHTIEAFETLLGELQA